MIPYNWFLLFYTEESSNEEITDSGMTNNEISEVKRELKDQREMGNETAIKRYIII